MLEQPPLTLDEQQLLLEIARNSIQHGLRFGSPLNIIGSDYHGTLCDPGAAFVTLEKQQRLRGCIGSVEAFRPLMEDVAHNAWHAAFEDPRFPPLEEGEFQQILLDISVLTVPEKLDIRSEAELKALLIPGQDGLILEDGYRRGLFLPAVWDKLPSIDDFVAHLKQKAGMSLDYWSETLEARRFYSFEFGEHDV